MAHAMASVGCMPLTGHEAAVMQVAGCLKVSDAQRVLIESMYAIDASSSFITPPIVDHIFSTDANGQLQASAVLAQHSLDRMKHTRFRPAPGRNRLAYGARKVERVVALGKGGEFGSHMLFGVVVEPPCPRRAAPRLAGDRAPAFLALHLMNNQGDYIASLSRVVARLGGIAEELGAEVYPHFAGARLLSDSPDSTDAQGLAVHSVRGVLAHNAGLTRQRTTSARFEPGNAFRAPATLLTEGTHGLLPKMYDLRARSEAQTHVPGSPGGARTAASGSTTWRTGSELRLGCGPGLQESEVGAVSRVSAHETSPTPPRAARRAQGAEHLACSAGVVNSARIKGTHNAMRTSMLAAQAALHPGAPFVSTASPAMFKHLPLPLPPPLNPPKSL
ncbi:hypothetical protein DFH09DRAFT_1316374 [Mycena vulgaris]|nr:hypothetical protein DFH09DRAFT_1316374 [Mycena vulgaris]